jgi:ABC-type sugar transport system ATPase subunit
MCFRLTRRRTPKAKIEARVRRAAQIMPVTPDLSRYPRRTNPSTTPAARAGS